MDAGSRMRTLMHRMHVPRPHALHLTHGLGTNGLFSSRNFWIAVGIAAMVIFFSLMIYWLALLNPETGEDMFRPFFYGP